MCMCMHRLHACSHACVFMCTFFLAVLSTPSPPTHTPDHCPRVSHKNLITAVRRFYALVSASTALLKAAVSPRFELVLLPAGDEMRLLKCCVSCCSEEQWRLCRLAVFLLPALRRTVRQPTLHPLTTCARHQRRPTAHSTRAFCGPMPVGHSVQLPSLHRLKACLQLTAQAQLGLCTTARACRERAPLPRLGSERVGEGEPHEAAACGTWQLVQSHAENHMPPRTTPRTTERLVRAGPQSGHSG